ncbi:MAG: hypothetical protein GWM92_12450, partial [Gemmatimonadetes bacterium]|nr:hypothetical protein [Gemmatimonadota bacterium]NIR78582.1 hypothetical protein [Gemmatimonadota bacterium]NIT88188.1 hypothetical protein [Gemmatimonadota bacterium]NIU31037.1 hypothetical protein [Gemmatimonadota bacterium]NIU35784.1 hypothetical protein [Gemmatimonadota bacterium]
FDRLLNPDAERGTDVREARRRYGIPERSAEEARRFLTSSPDDPWLALLAWRERGLEGMPDGAGPAEVEAYLRSASLLATTSIPTDEDAFMEIVERA